jgi:hypothetical protein
MVIGTGENLVFTNSDRALTSGENHLIRETSSDTILSGNSLDNQILANTGDDTVYGNVEFFEFSSGTVSRAYLLSGLTPPTFTSGVDVVDLSFLGGTFDALGGDDVLSYKGGSIDIDGNIGSDTLDFSTFGSAIEVDLTSSTGTNFRTQDTDNLRGTVWRDIGSSSNVENIIGTTFEDRLVGDSANNFLLGGKGNDILLGGLQPDAVYSTASNNGLLAVGNFGNSDIYEKQVGDFNGDGVDIIEDFTLNVDTIDLSSIVGISSINDLGLIQVGTDAVIQVGAGYQM